MTHAIQRLLTVAMFALALAGAQAAEQVEQHTRSVAGVPIHYLQTGSGDGTPVVLLHGYAEESDMWIPLMQQLAPQRVVIAPDLPGAGQSGFLPAYTKVAMAQSIHALVQQLGYKKVKIVGHDIGLMVAYAYAAQYPDETDSVVLMESFLPGVGDWYKTWQRQDKWHFHFYGDTAEKLTAGRERIYLDHFWNDFAADPQHAVPEHTREQWAAVYAQPGRMHAGFEWFHAFELDAKDFGELSKTPLTMPLLTVAGEKSAGVFLIGQGKLVDPNAQGIVIPGVGHWLMEEAPQQTMAILTAFINDPASVQGIANR
ncbi:pimeloyl-ACP methyl ester carboxylesterase [Silvimonas terrae]|uniref:Pimeloyl-ACP methyl ester carboxylesterase n=1 Tax=Silvimonas terrae TaxID=300266 RepID=A0A840RD11_9NEIS|nr:alpha/beta hydrolase [Silvimonas terrae]MBB5190428.1 pimeloyl-ACP methyl ester carboxylesterase [Silvimonas terrae]